MFQSSKAVKNIFYLNLFIFVLTLLNGNPIYRIFALYPPHKGFELWQLFTYQFLHGGFLHIIFNMLAFLSFGPSVEDILGSRKFTNCYLACGISGALLYMLITPPPYILVGASASIFGILVMFAVFFPNVKLYLFFLPFGFKSKYFVSVIVFWEIIQGFLVRDGIGHWGHVGGAVLGLIFALAEKNKSKYAGNS